MNRFTPLEKRSKKEQRAYFKAQRATWGELNPVSRTAPGAKEYNRKKLKQNDRRGGSLSHYDDDKLPLLFLGACNPGLRLVPFPMVVLYWKQKKNCMKMYFPKKRLNAGKLQKTLHRKN